jgi:hypothetical protein
MHLQRDESFQIRRVHQVGRGHAVDPCADGIAQSDHPRVVPLAGFEGVARRFVLREVGQPAAARLVEDSAGPEAPGSQIAVDLNLEPEDFAALIRRIGMAADLNTGVHFGVDQELVFENEVSVAMLGDKKGMLGVRRRCSGENSIPDFEFRLAAEHPPPGQSLPVE